MTPHVTCICLTADRQQHTDRAVKCFLQQTYPTKHLLILDNGVGRYIPVFETEELQHVTVLRLNPPTGHTVGGLRNLANGVAVHTDILAHWDSDDWSHPLRLAWQVQQLKETKAELVGYNSMIFWRDGEAWAFVSDGTKAKMIGASFLYWRRTWEQQKFREVNKGEDNEWQRNVAGHAAPGFFKDEPAMIASMLPDGAGGWYDDPAFYRSPNWERAEDWDAKVRRLLA